MWENNSQSREREREFSKTTPGSYLLICNLGFFFRMLLTLSLLHSIINSGFKMRTLSHMEVKVK